MINVSKLIYNKLKDVASTFPLVAENTTKFPFIIYRTDAQRPVENKDMIYEWTYEIQVNVVDDNYDEVVELCDNAVEKLLELNDGYDINIESIRETYIDDAFVKEINIKINI